VFGEPQRVPEVTDATYPFTLLTGRGSASQWHTLTRTGKSSLLDKLGATTPYVELSPLDAAELGITPGQRVIVESRRGRMIARAFVTHSVRPGQVFVPMHYAGTNELTFAAFDPTIATARLQGVCCHDPPAERSRHAVKRDHDHAQAHPPRARHRRARNITCSRRRSGVAAVEPSPRGGEQPRARRHHARHVHRCGDRTIPPPGRRPGRSRTR
jgi:predicted molibdopterin-dependent oxidoreductase YjgC